MVDEFKAMIGGKFLLLTNLQNTSIDMDIDDVISTFNTAMIETANELSCQHCSKRNIGPQQIFLICVMKGENKKCTKEMLKV